MLLVTLCQGRLDKLGLDGPLSSTVPFLPYFLFCFDWVGWCITKLVKPDGTGKAADSFSTGWLPASDASGKWIVSIFVQHVHLFASILTLRLANRSKFLKRLHCCSMTELNVLKNKVLDSKYRHLFLALGFVTVIGKTFPQQSFHGFSY